MSVRDLFAEERPQIFRGEFDTGEEALGVTESSIVMGSFVLDRTCVSGNTLEIGACVAAEVNLTLLNNNGALDDFSFEGSELTASVGVYDDNDTAQMIQLGKYIVDGVPKIRDTVSITALDRMVKFDVPVNGLETWWGATKSVTQIVNRCCSVCGVTLATNIASFPNAGYTFAKPDELADGMTYRQLLSYCVGAMGKVAWIDAEGLLEIGFFGNLQLELTTENRYASDYEDYTITITGVVCTKTEENQSGESYDHEYVVGTDDYAFDLSNNPIVASDPTTTLAALSGLIGLSYVPFTATTTPCPWIFPMDKVAYEKADGTVLNSVVTNYTFLMNGNNGVQSVGESPTEKSRANVGSVASQIKQVIDYAKELAEETLASASDNATALITSATGGQVYFKKVNGVIEEIDIMDDTCYADFTSASPTYTVGKCWRWNKNGFGFSSTGYNGTYTLAMTMDGNIVADFLKVGTISSGSGSSQNYWDLVNNVLCLNITEGSIHLTTSSGTADHITLRHNDTWTTVSSDYFNAHSEDSEYITSYGAYAVSSRIGGFTTTGGLKKFGMVTTSYIYDSQKPGSVPYQRTIIDPEGITIEALDTQTGVQQTYSSLSLTGLVINSNIVYPPQINSYTVTSNNEDGGTSYWREYIYSSSNKMIVGKLICSASFPSTYGSLKYSDLQMALPTAALNSGSGNWTFQVDANHWGGQGGIFSTNIHSYDLTTGIFKIYVANAVSISGGLPIELTLIGYKF